MARSYLSWLGDDLRKRVEKASMRAIDRTTEAAAEYARNHHPGWRTVTGTAEGSIGTNPARVQKKRIIGNVTGGAGEAYYLFVLEVKHGSAIRNAGDIHFPTLGVRLEQEYNR